jgi:hypothetical protein
MKNQNVLGLVAIVAATLIGQKTLAFTDVCTLANTEVPASIRVAKLELASYKEKIKVECELSEKYQQMILKARKFGIALEQISEYQALRYIDRAYYESARVSNTPVPVITVRLSFGMGSKSAHVNSRLRELELSLAHSWR